MKDCQVASDEDKEDTSDEEDEWDYLKGVDMYSVNSYKTKKGANYRREQRLIIEGAKLADKILETKMIPDTDKAKELRAKRQHIKDRVEKNYDKSNQL